MAWMLLLWWWKVLPAPTSWVWVPSVFWLCCRLHSRAPQSDESAEASAPRLWWSAASQMWRWMVIGPYHCKRDIFYDSIVSHCQTVFSLSECCFSIDLPFNVRKLLCVAHYLSKVDVKHVSTVSQHDVVIVAVTDPQDEGGHTPPCTRVDEV